MNRCIHPSSFMMLRRWSDNLLAHLVLYYLDVPLISLWGFWCCDIVEARFARHTGSILPTFGDPSVLSALPIRSQTCRKHTAQRATRLRALGAVAHRLVKVSKNGWQLAVGSLL